MTAITIGLEKRFSQQGFVPKNMGSICGRIFESNCPALTIMADGTAVFFRVVSDKIPIGMGPQWIGFIVKIGIFNGHMT